MARITKLEAVNMILDVIGEDAVSSLSSGVPDAEVAERKLNEVSKEVQARGWHCNTDTKMKLLPDIDGYIQLPANTLRVDPSYTSSNLDLAERGGKLYDKDNQTFTFTAGVYVDIIYELDYESLPYNLAKYIAARAARVYQEQMQGSRVLEGFALVREQEAYADLHDSEWFADDANILQDSRSVAITSERNNRYRRL